MGTALGMGTGALLAVAWIWAGAAKLRRTQAWQTHVRSYHLPRTLRAASVLLLPWVELGIAVVVLHRPAVGAVASLALLAVFSMAVVRARAKQRSNLIGCGCFGGTGVRDYRLLLGRNAALAALAGVVLAGSRSWPALLPSTAWTLVAMAALAGTATLWGTRRLAAHLRVLDRPEVTGGPPPPAA